MASTPACGGKAKVVSITAEQSRLLAMPSIASQLPLRYSNGYVLERFEGQCSVCGGQIAPCDLHGSVVQPISSVAVIEAIGGCRYCNIAVPFFMRVKDNGITETRDSKGNWVVGRVASEDGMTPLQAKVVAVVAASTVLACFIMIIVG